MVLPAHGTRGATHIAFAIAESDRDAWRAHLQSHGIAIEYETSWTNGGWSLYFRDPAGNSLDLATPRLWQLPEPPWLDSTPDT